MADFVAVIRRAVDGLANNTPDMRAKVYDKARGAVQRQLENMKPRPPEDMLRRQMEKLEAAIASVEAEHAEALPPEDEILEAPLAQEEPVQHVAAEVYARPSEEDSLSEERSAAYDDERYEPQTAEERVADEPVEEAAEPYRDWSAEPVDPTPYRAAENYPYPAALEPQSDEPYYHDDAEPQGESVLDVQPQETVEQQYGDWREDLPQEAQEPRYAEEHVAAAEPAQPDEYRAEPHAESVYDRHHDVVQPAATEEPYPAAPSFEQADEQEVASYRDTHFHDAGIHEVAPQEPAHQEPAHQEPAQEDWRGGEQRSWEDEQPAPQAAPQEDWGWEPPYDGRGDDQATQASSAAVVWDEVPDLVQAGPVEPANLGVASQPVEAHFDAETHVAANDVRMPSVSELPELPQTDPAIAAAAAADLAAFAAYGDERKATLAEPTGAASEKDPWSDLEDLIGFDKNSARKGAASDTDADDLMPPPVRPYRVAPKPKRNYAGIVLGMVGLLLVCSGAYAVWINRDSLSDMFTGLMQPSQPAGSQQTAAAPATPAPASPAPSAQAPAATPPQNNNRPANAAAPATPAPAAPTKFTQRLLPDGTEVDTGAAGAAGGLAQSAEGQSVAQLNTAPAAPSAQPAAPAGANNAAPPAAGAAPAPSATPATTPALAGEKMFLYEERVGQTAPMAIEGAVAWSVQREAASNGQQQPVIQGRITIPGRGLTALMTFKRNADPSLPASHLIEIVFAVPPDFEGGAIDSVQRIALKATEQDRGNALIAVPAKITDDFHMIALNDFPDARNTNLELLSTRNWIDIPVAYRNGRRALFTLQKGPEGTRIFQDAIREWNALGNLNR